MASENVRKQFKLLVIMAALSLWFTSLFGVQAEAASQLASNKPYLFFQWPRTVPM